MSLGRVVLNPIEREELERRASCASFNGDGIRRAKIILMLEAGVPYREICSRLGCATHYISRLKGRFMENRLSGLDPGFLATRPDRRGAQTEARVLEWTRREPTDGTSYWSSRRLAKEAGVSQTTVSRVWRKFGIQRHQSRKYVARDDPEFDQRAADVIGLYLNPPVHAAVFCVGEKTAVQGMDRLDAVFQSSPGGADGTLALYGDLNGRAADIVSGNPDPGKAEFVDFLAEIIVSQPTDHEIHVIADNLSANKTRKVCRFFQANPNVRIHSTPAYFNWIKLIEIWFSKIQRDIISRNNNYFDNDFARTLVRYIRKCHKRRTPIRWIY
jgi:transposase